MCTKTDGWLKRFAWLLPGLLVLCATGKAGQTNPAAPFSGRWEAEAPNGPWVFELSATGVELTGRVLQHGGTPGPGPIYSGKIEGNVATFKVKHPIVAPVVKEITFTGRLVGGEILFERSVEVLLNGQPNTPTPNDRGVFGTAGPTQVIARRVGPVSIAPIPVDATRPIDVNGRWESLRWNLDVWILDLKSTGDQLTGAVSMTAGPGRQPLVVSQPLPIFDGRVEGNRVLFKSKSPDNVRTISFTGTVQGDEIAFTRSVEVPAGGATGFEAVYGALAPLAFLAKRVSSPLIPRVPDKIESELQEAQKKWQARTIKGYEFVVQWNCFCPMPTLPLTYRANGDVGTVGLNAAIAALLNLPPEALRPILERYATVDQIFAFLNAAAARQPYLLKIEYDPMLGYPKAGTLHPGGTSVDDNLEFRITDFRVMN